MYKPQTAPSSTSYSDLYSHYFKKEPTFDENTVNRNVEKGLSLAQQSIEKMSNIEASLEGTSSNLSETDLLYNEYECMTKKGQLLITDISKREAAAAKKIRLAFWFVIIVFIYVFLRRILKPDLYRFKASGVSEL